MRANQLPAYTPPAAGIGRRGMLDVLRDGRRTVAALFRLWRQRRRTRYELTCLDDRTLRDIGLTRGDAEFLINKPFWRE